MENCVNDILVWYQAHRRELPWRRDKDPYHVWISEIMLQQTRIEAVITYYKKFMDKLPTVYELANVEDDELLKLWEGLGYYNRVRNLKKAAQMIISEYDGVFPTTYQQLINLPGIGEYTASAIASICFLEKQVTVDGNVMRVYTRFYNDFSNISKESTRKMIQRNLLEIVPKESGNFNEGMMEIGEQVCIPNGMPKCELCPLVNHCLSYRNRNYFEFPVRDEKKEKPITVFTVLVFVWNNKTLVQKRTAPGLLHNLFEFVNVEGLKDEKEVLAISNTYGVVSSIKKSITYTHVFTHKKWEMHSYFIFMDEVNCPNLFTTVQEVEDKMAIPTAFQPFLFAVKEELV